MASPLSFGGAFFLFWKSRIVAEIQAANSLSCLIAYFVLLFAGPSRECNGVLFLSKKGSLVCVILEVCSFFRPPPAGNIRRLFFKGELDLSECVTKCSKI